MATGEYLWQQDGASALQREFFVAPHERRCVGCGVDNPDSLGLETFILPPWQALAATAGDVDSATIDSHRHMILSWGRCTPTDTHVGWPSIVHGGILSMLADCAAVSAGVWFCRRILGATQTSLVTRSMSVRFLQSFRPKEPLYTVTKIQKQEKRRLTLLVAFYPSLPATMPELLALSLAENDSPPPRCLVTVELTMVTLSSL
jgi:hypothetical protein